MTLKFGSRGDTVKQVQTLLGITADGIYGKQTEAAVRAYQLAHSLTADGIAGAKTLASMGIEAASGDIVIKCEDLKQFSSPHGSMPYGPDKSYSTYKSGGCGVTSFAVCYRALGLAPAGETSTQTIQRLGKYAWQNGYRIKGNGTTSGLFATNGCKRTSLKASSIVSAVREGHLVILLIRNGFPNGYTGSGHYIVAYGIQGDRLLLRDVGSSKASRQYCTASKVGSGLKGAWRIEVR